MFSGSLESDPRDAETRRIGDTGDVRAITGECELRVKPGADADGERVEGCAIGRVLGRLAIAIQVRRLGKWDVEIRYAMEGQVVSRLSIP